MSINKAFSLIFTLKDYLEYEMILSNWLFSSRFIISHSWFSVSKGKFTELGMWSTFLERNLGIVRGFPSPLQHPPLSYHESVLGPSKLPQTSPKLNLIQYYLTDLFWENLWFWAIYMTLVEKTLDKSRVDWLGAQSTVLLINN